MKGATPGAPALLLSEHASHIAGLRRRSPPCGRGPVGGESIACRGRALRTGSEGGSGTRTRGPAGTGGGARRCIVGFRQEARRAPGEAGGGGGGGGEEAAAAALLGAGSARLERGGAGRRGPGRPAAIRALGARGAFAAFPQAAPPSPASAAAPHRPPRTRRRRRAEPGPARRDAAPPGAAEPAPRLHRARSRASALRGCGRSALLARQLCSRGREAARAGFRAAPRSPGPAAAPRPRGSHGRLEQDNRSPASRPAKRCGLLAAGIING